MSKPIKIMMTLIIALTLIGVVAIMILLYTDSSEAENITLDDRLEHSFVTEEITTDLADGEFLTIQFRIITDSEDPMEYLQKGESFQIKNTIIKTLTVKSSEDFRTSLGNIEEDIKLQLNQLLNEGLVTDVFIIDKVLQ